jgi:hypothetical protein
MDPASFTLDVYGRNRQTKGQRRGVGGGDLEPRFFVSAILLLANL